MLKPRDPSTNAWAAARVIELVGVDVAADAIERSASLLYQWADPDNPAQPVLWQAQRLDDLCAEARGETPFRDVWERRMRRPQAQGRCPLSLAITADRDVADMVASIHEALADGRFCAAERMEIGQIVARVRAACTAIETEINE